MWVFSRLKRMARIVILGRVEQWEEGNNQGLEGSSQMKQGGRYSFFPHKLFPTVFSFLTRFYFVLNLYFSLIRSNPVSDSEMHEFNISHGSRYRHLILIQQPKIQSVYFICFF